MDAQARAGIELHDSVLRYAEVERYGSRARLLRLGTCDFDFDLVQDVLRSAEPAALAVVKEALQDVFAGTIASVFTISLHPHLTTDFFTVVPSGASEGERRRQFTHEAALVTGVTSTADLDVTATAHDDAARSTGTRYSVLATPAALGVQLKELLRGMPQTNYSLRATTQDAASIVSQRWRQEQTNGRLEQLVLAVGAYRGRVEIAVVESGVLLFMHSGRAETTADMAFACASILDQLGRKPAEVREILLYGDRIPEDAAGVFEGLWSVEVQRLNPLVLVDLDPDTLTERFASEAYVPCIGAAL